MYSSTFCGIDGRGAQAPAPRAIKAANFRGNAARRDFIFVLHLQKRMIQYINRLSEMVRLTHVLTTETDCSSATATGEKKRGSEARKSGCPGTPDQAPRRTRAIKCGSRLCCDRPARSAVVP